ncbi:MAG: universal stress protein [Candidatus Eremiobacteraeota bacterium]|nr:universal stress protein [Candidatus Eremiobacteraeota bacterium]MBV8721569.1 universal stress protein [Candidatus Eremiobacteraeota bacterium]
MIKTVLVATDGSDAAMAAMRTAVELVRSLQPGAALHVASAVAYAEIPSMLAKQPADAPDLLAEQAEQALQLAAAAAFAEGVEVETHLLSGDVVPALLQCAAGIGADVIVAGFHGRNRLVRLVMGSVAGDLVRANILPVMLVGAPVVSA